MNEQTKVYEANPGGRKLMLNLQRARKFYRAILIGNTIGNAAAQIGVSNHTVLMWRAEGRKHAEVCPFDEPQCIANECKEAAKRKFYNNSERARALYESKLVTRLDKHTQHSQNGSLTLEVLARRNHKDWGKKSELAVKHSGQVNQVAKVVHSIEPTTRLKLGQYLTAKAQAQIEGANVDEAELVED